MTGNFQNLGKGTIVIGDFGLSHINPITPLFPDRSSASTVLIRLPPARPPLRETVLLLILNIRTLLLGLAFALVVV